MPGDIGLPGILPFLGYFSQISVGAEQISTGSRVKSFVVRAWPAFELWHFSIYQWSTHACRIPQPFGIRGGTCVNRGLNWRYTHVKIAKEAFAADGGKRSERGSLTEKEWKGTGRQNEDAYRTKDSGKKQHWKACVRCAVGTVTGYMDLRTGDEIKPIFDMNFGCDQRAYAGCRDPALWPQDKCSV